MLRLDMVRCSSRNRAGVNTTGHPSSVSWWWVLPCGHSCVLVCSLVFCSRVFSCLVGLVLSLVQPQSEFQEAHTVSRLLGAPPGYVGFAQGGILTETMKRSPFTVVLLDEVRTRTIPAPRLICLSRPLNPLGLSFWLLVSLDSAAAD